METVCPNLSQNENLANISQKFKILDRFRRVLGGVFVEGGESREIEEHSFFYIKEVKSFNILINSLFLHEDLKGGICLFLCGQSLEEGLVGEEAVLVLGVGELLEDSLGVLLGDLIGQVGDEILELGQHHGTVLVLVVE